MGVGGGQRERCGIADQAKVASLEEAGEKRAAGRNKGCIATVDKLEK